MEALGMYTRTYIHTRIDIIIYICICITHCIMYRYTHMHEYICNMYGIYHT
jgi:hypothetical protein